MSYPVYMPSVGNKLSEELDDAFRKATQKHAAYPTLHHALAVIREEYLELEKEIFIQDINKDAIRKEALHVAVTALRLIKDCEL